MRDKNRTQANVLHFCSTYLERWEKGLNPELPREAEQVRRICTNLLNNYFRYRGFIKYFIKELTGDRKVDKRVANLLELILTQLIFQRGISHFHAVNAAVDYSNQNFKKASGFVNGVLRNFVRRHGSLLEKGPVEELRRIFGKDYNQIFLGNKLFMLWRERFSELELQQLIEILEVEVPLTVRMKKGFERSTPLFLEPLELPENAPDCDMFVCDDPASFFAEYIDDFFVQDPATIVAAGMVETDGENLTIGDFCAAPGGKSAFVAEQLSQNSTLFSCDVNPSRLKTLEANLCQYDNVKVMQNDALAPRFEDGTFDCVLLDVPCSNSGVIRKRPDVKWRFSQKKVRELCDLQRDIFSATVPLVKEGGSIVYSTCSIEPEENAEQVKFFLEQFPFCNLEKEIAQLPGEHNDGAYAALIRVGKRS